MRTTDVRFSRNRKAQVSCCKFFLANVGVECKSLCLTCKVSSDVFMQASTASKDTSGQGNTGSKDVSRSTFAAHFSDNPKVWCFYILCFFKLL